MPKTSATSKLSKLSTPSSTITPVAVKLDAEMKNSLWALAQFVCREGQHETLRRDALKAWGDYQETGLHVSAREADEWLAQLEQGFDVFPPTPRLSTVNPCRHR